MGRPAPTVRLVALAAALCGCAGGFYTASARLTSYLDTGQANLALAEVNRLLGVTADDQRPPDLKNGRVLHLLTRARLLQDVGRYELSALDFQEADNNLEVLSLSGNPLDSLSKYLYSEKKTVYKATPLEKTLINTLNMANYLARGDLAGAKVEARRLRVFEDFLKDGGKSENLNPLGVALAGLAFEMAGEAPQAMRFYADSLERGGVPGLEETMAALHQRTGASDPRVRRWAAAPRAAGGEVVVVCLAGRAPQKIPLDVPLNWPVWSTCPEAAYLSVHARERAALLAGLGFLKVVRMPGLNPAPSPIQGADLSIAGRSEPFANALDVEAGVRRDYAKMQGTYLMAALSRMVSRAMVARFAEAAAQGDKKKNSGLVGALVEGALMMMDVPDTRSWSSLPAKVFYARGRWPAGTHRLSVAFDGTGETVDREVTVVEGQTQFVLLSNKGVSHD
ncbi:MAG: hypothetical protein E6Q99_08380 [Elusimicrobia bacterium]|nr:MAG: hypothetical protein E6Q99_08380 [Elusimicrobiota bacterium]